jgi:predicted Zn-dependent peptidase
LVFRVGRADETLLRSGITHLIEHLVLHGVDRPDRHFNGATSPRTTTFFVRGDAAQVTSFFDTVCRGLRDLPVDRLDTEKALLRAEAAGRSRGVSEPLLTWRYGPVGYGLPGYPEFGLAGLSADDLRAWAAAWFTRGNAALWISGGPPPEGLRLDLPDGPRMPLPHASSALPMLPAYFTADADGVAFDAVVPRSSASTVYAVVLDRRLHGQLRRELGISYDARAEYAARDAENATITAIADALPEHHADVCRTFVDVLIDLARTEVPAEELDSVREYLRRSLFDSDNAAAWPVGAADRLLSGLPVLAPEEIWDGIREVSTANVRDIGRQVLATGLAMVPHGQAIGRGGFVTAPSGSASAVDGRSYLPVGATESGRRLVVGEEGLSIVESLHVATVRYADCVAMLAWPDGARLLFAPDAVTVRVEPQLWAVPAAVLAAVDAAMRDRTLHLPARDPATVPQPPKPSAVSAAPSAPAARPRRGRANRSLRLPWRGLLLVALGLLFVATMTAALNNDSTAWTAATVVILLRFLRGLAVRIRVWRRRTRG